MTEWRSQKPDAKRPLNRREFLKFGGGVFGALAGSGLLSKSLLQPEKVVQASRSATVQEGVLSDSQAVDAEPNLHLAATDGWIYLPSSVASGKYHPDDLAPVGLNTYMFGYHDVTGLSNTLVHAQKMKAQAAAPFFALQETEDYTLKLTNLGLQMRPDLIDAHTVHFHGFRNAIPIFDGEPHSSVGVPIVRDLTYFYRPRHPGTYLYHCHFEETEHVHMGMVGMCYIKPKLNLDNPGHRYAYNDPISEYDREFLLCLSEVWSYAHWCDSHIQLPEWSDYNPDFYLLNGRVYPDTLAPNGSRDPATGESIPPAGRDELKYQPVSSLVKVNAGDRVLLRFANLGFQPQTMKLAGIPMRVIAKDATLLRGQDNTDLTYVSASIAIGPGESVDTIFIAPAHQGPEPYNRYLLYNRNYGHMSNGGGQGYGGQMTEVHVYPAGTLPQQDTPNT